ncbi:allantoate amidohydrolase [Peribacillus butanolivorans]|uniref:Zn-dependent hydrolase n=1 Tax=Peribacillus butanolivorans TaxID=421767 RepID=UPI00369E4FC3
MTKLQINIDRLKHNLLEVGQIANSGEKGYTRLAYSKEEKAAIEWLKQKMINLSLSVKQDRLGNTFGRLGDVDQPAICFGSHLDTVPEGGLYDGALGVIVGLECIQTLIESGYNPEIPLELAAFVGEEANPLGGTFGSRAVAGLVKHSNKFEKKLQSLNFTWHDVVSVRKKPTDYHCYLELHIEQGALLETIDKKVGIVTSIAGILRLSVRVNGKASHSGTTPMKMRKDALLDAAKLIQTVNSIAIDEGGNIVATVGEITASPNLANVVPGQVELMIEIRGSNWEEMKTVEEKIRKWMLENIDAEVAIAVEKQPNALTESIQKCIEEVCKTRNTSYKYMFSGANHDANSLTSITDVGMIFVPSKAGLSHHPDEFTSWLDIEIGANVMLKTILSLCRKYTE